MQQQLVALAVNLQLVRALVEEDSAGSAELLNEMTHDMQKVLESAAGLAQRIHPPLLDAGGLGAALRSAAVASDVRAEISVASGLLPSPISGAVYFSWLDVLESAGESQPATIAVVSDDRALTFDLGGPAAAALCEDVLTRIRDRVETFGGRLTIEPASEGRTYLGGWIPLDR